MKKENKSVGFGIASLVTSLIGFFGFVAPYIAILFSISAIVFCVIQQKRYKTGLATAGLVIGILGVIGNIFWLLTLLLILMMGAI